MMETMIESKVPEILERDYPHVKYPASMLARVVYADVPNKKYYIRILTPGLEIDERFPEIPSVKSTDDYSVGDIIVITLLYGKTNMIHIIGKAA